MFCASLEIVSPIFCNTPAFTLIVLVLQITHEMKNLVLLLFAIALKIHPCTSSLGGILTDCDHAMSQFP